MSATAHRAVYAMEFMVSTKSGGLMSLAVIAAPDYGWKPDR